VEKSALEKLIVTNTLPQEENQARCKKIEVIDIGPVLGEVIRRSHYGESISKLFNEVPY
jgi:ribose-phosphate pyrophosphokinase